MTAGQLRSQFFAREMLNKTLTAREEEVMMLIAQDLQTKEIAARLGIAYGTADKHKNRVFEKLGLHTRVRVAHWAIAHGFVQPITDWSTR